MSSRRPLISIGISTYNRADSYLPDALRSALSQTYPNLEVVVSDNCSDDGTPALVASFDDPRVRYFRQEENIGANNNFNFCLEQARGAYFLLLHDDDRIDPDFVKACMDGVADDTSLGVVRSGTRVIDGSGTVLSERPNLAGGASELAFMLGWFTGDTVLYLCSTLFHTERLKAEGGFQSKHNLFQDVVAEMKLATKYGRGDIADVKASFRRHEDNRGSAARLQEWVEDSLYLLDVMCELAPEEARELVRARGQEFFALKNYRYVAALPSFRERVKAYYRVSGAFGHRYPPTRYALRRIRKAIQRRLPNPSMRGGTPPTTDFVTRDSATSSEDP